MFQLLYMVLCIFIFFTSCVFVFILLTCFLSQDKFFIFCSPLKVSWSVVPLVIHLIVEL